jgi:hypothetical protein
MQLTIVILNIENLQKFKILSHRKSRVCLLLTAHGLLPGGKLNYEFNVCQVGSLTFSYKAAHRAWPGSKPHVGRSSEFSVNLDNTKDIIVSKLLVGFISFVDFDKMGVRI